MNLEIYYSELERRGDLGKELKSMDMIHQFNDEDEKLIIMPRGMGELEGVIDAIKKGNHLI